jgi:CheY-like chemotaxis protein
VSTLTPRRRLLVIDDDELSRELREDVASQAESGAAPPIVLMDVRMPGLSGTALAAALRASAPQRTLRILAMSASPAPQECAAAFDGFLRKPFSPGELDALLGAKQESMVSAESASPAPGSESPEPGPKSPAPEPVLDDVVTARLAASMSATQLRLLYMMCAEDAKSRLGHIHRAAADRDEETCRREAHTLKGGAAFIGARQLARAAEQIERYGAEDSGARLESLALAYDRFRFTLNKLQT